MNNNAQELDPQPQPEEVDPIDAAFGVAFQRFADAHIKIIQQTQQTDMIGTFLNQRVLVEHFRIVLTELAEHHGLNVSRITAKLTESLNQQCEVLERPRIAVASGHPRRQ